MNFYIKVFTIILFIASLCSVSHKKINNRVVITDELYYISIFYVAFILFFISAFRYKVGTDYTAYFDYAKREILPYTFIHALKNSEFFFVFFAKLSYELCGNMQIMYIAIAFTFIVFLVKGILYYERDIFIPIFFLIISTTFFISLNAMRQMASFAIFLYASRYIFEKNFKKYFLYIVLAFFWHTSSLLYLIFYFFPNYKIRKAFFVLLIFGYLAKSVLNKLIISFLSATGIPIQYYFTMAENASSKSFLLISFIIAFSFYLFALEDDNSVNNFLFNFSILGVLISIFVDGIPGGFRLVYLVWPMYIVICPYVLKRAKSFKYILLVIYGGIFLFYFYRQHIIGNSGEVVPYNFIFGGIK